MCIRDRAAAGLPAPASASSAPRVVSEEVAKDAAQGLVTLQQQVERMRTPVSYTHLRAHETSAHL
eukprot:3095758-Alexandrium_andersonii.AAC.1